MRSITDEVATPFAHIINCSFKTGEVPQESKIAKVIPIYKNGDKQLLNNYRPISLLPAFSKLLEKIMSKRLIKYLNEYKIIYKHQYGFREKHSTIHPLIHLLDNVASANDKIPSQFNMSIFLDRS